MDRKLLKNDRVSPRSVMTRSAIRRERKSNIEVVKFIKIYEEKNDSLIGETLPTINIANSDKKKRINSDNEEKEISKAFEIIKEQKKIYEEILKNNKKNENDIVVNYRRKKVKNNNIGREIISNKERSTNNKEEKAQNICTFNDKDVYKNHDNKKENERTKKTTSNIVAKKENKNVSSRGRSSILSGAEKYNTIQELINDARIRRMMSESNRRH
uniref:Bromodomain protein n=1 Tax=Strongyloides papillosus TaxID=174720 RepID=A0A0N5C9F4_STREA